MKNIITTLTFLAVYNIPSNAQIIFMDNWSDIANVKKITIYHYTPVVSLGEIEQDKLLLKLIGNFDADGKVVDERVFYSKYDQKIVYHIKYDSDQTISEIYNNAEMLNGYTDCGEFTNRIKYFYDDRKRATSIEKWCSLKCYSCWKVSRDKQKSYTSKSKYIDDTWILEMRLNRVFDEFGNLSKEEFELVNDNGSKETPPNYFDVYTHLIRAINESSMYTEPEEKKLDYSINPYRYISKEIEERKIEIPETGIRVYYAYNRKYEYLFNDKGDWTKCIAYDGSRPVRIILREIEYH